MSKMLLYVEPIVYDFCRTDNALKNAKLAPLLITCDPFTCRVACNYEK